MKVSPRVVVLVLIVSLVVAPALWAAPKSEPAAATGSGGWSGWVSSVVGWLGGLIPLSAGEEAVPPTESNNSENDTGPYIDPNG